MIRMTGNDSMGDADDNTKRTDGSHSSGYIILGPRRLVQLFRLSGFTDAYEINTDNDLATQLERLPDNMIIITTQYWKERNERLKNHPNTITMSESLEGFDDTADIEKLKERVLGMKTGGS